MEIDTYLHHTLVKTVSFKNVAIEANSNKFGLHVVQFWSFELLHFCVPAVYFTWDQKFCNGLLVCQTILINNFLNSKDPKVKSQKNGVVLLQTKKKS